MNGYIALYQGRQAEVYADTSYQAQCIAAKIFNTKKRSDISVYLCQREDGSEMIHSTAGV